MATESQEDVHKRLQEEQRLRLMQALIDARADVVWLVQQLAERDWAKPAWFDDMQPVLATRVASASNAGRKAAIATLEATLDVVQSVVAHLHATLVELRDEHAFTLGSGLDRLAELGVVAAPSAPRKKALGRPLGRVVDHALVFFTSIALEHGHIGGRKLTQREALDLAAEALRARGLSTRQSFEPEDLRKARARIDPLKKR